MPSEIISEQKGAVKTKVFISYSRRDLAFADRLVEALYYFSAYSACSAVNFLYDIVFMKWCTKQEVKWRFLCE